MNPKTEIQATETTERSVISNASMVYPMGISIYRSNRYFHEPGDKLHTSRHTLLSL